jgi:hypothetical protein
MTLQKDVNKTQSAINAHRNSTLYRKWIKLKQFNFPNSLSCASASLRRSYRFSACISPAQLFTFLILRATELKPFDLVKCFNLIPRIKFHLIKAVGLFILLGNVNWLHFYGTHPGEFMDAITNYKPLKKFD